MSNKDPWLTDEEQARLDEIDSQYYQQHKIFDKSAAEAVKAYSKNHTEENLAIVERTAKITEQLFSEWQAKRQEILDLSDNRSFNYYTAHIPEMITMIQAGIVSRITLLWAATISTKPTEEERAKRLERIKLEEENLKAGIAHNEKILEAEPDNEEVRKATQGLKDLLLTDDYKIPYLTQYDLMFSESNVRQQIESSYSRYLMYLKANNPDEYQTLLAYMNLCIESRERIAETQYQSIEEEPAQTYRTKAKAAKDSNITNQLPSTLAVPTLTGYQNATSLNQSGNAYLQPLRSTDGFIFKDGKIYLEANGNDKVRQISEVELINIKTKEGIQDIELPLLRTFYSIILFEFEKNKEVKDVITLYLPDLAAYLGMHRNLNKQETANIIAKTQSFHNIIGVLKFYRNGNPTQSLYPVLNFEGYKDETNTISFSSPYMNMVIKEIANLSIQKDKKGQPILKKNGEPKRIASHSYLVKSEISKEKNKAAVENVFIICTMIEQAGENIPRIKASTIIERNPQLAVRLESSAKPTQLLKRTFEKTWELLRDETRLLEVYHNIQLPDPKDPAFIPTTKTLDMVFSFPHDGKSQS